MKNPGNKSAFTLVETVVVMTIVMILAALVVGSMGYVQGKQAREQAKAQIALLSKAIEEYRMDMGAYPGDPIPGSNTEYYGGDSADTASGENLSNVLYRTLFFEGWDLAENGNSDSNTARKIYVSQLDPRDNKQGWVTRLATNAAVPPDLEILDPWGKPYRYRRGTNARNPDFDLWSVGKDGKTNTGSSDTDLKHEDNKDDIWN